MSEFRGDLDPIYVGKALGPATVVEELTVDNEPALWIEGAPHFFFYRDQGGGTMESELRLAQNVLLVERETCWCDSRGRSVASGRSGSPAPCGQPPQRNEKPHDHERGGGSRAHQVHGRGCVEHVGHEHHRPRHGDRQEPEAEDDDPVAGPDDVLLVLLAKFDAVVGRGRDQADRGRRGGEQRDEVDELLQARDIGEALVEQRTSKKANSTCTPGSATRSSPIISCRLRSMRSLSLSSRPVSGCSATEETLTSPT